MNSNDRMLHENWAIPSTTRSKVVLEIASHIVGSDQALSQAKVSLRKQGTDEWPVCLLASDTPRAINAIVSREADLGIVNPAGPLTLAYRGHGPWSSPQPVRLIAVIPSLDYFVFGIRAEFGITSLDQLASKKPRLRVALRGQPDHSLHLMLDHVTAACGFSTEDIERWGGELRRAGPLPFGDGAKIAAVRAGEIDAIFDEAAQEWIDAGIDAGMTIASLPEAAISKLEAMGYRAATIRRDDYPKLPEDVRTIDFSGWAIYVHADLSDDIVGMICEGLDSRKQHIPWQGEGPLPVERMCRDAPDTPIDVPFHPAAERIWRQRGYLA